MLDNNVILLLDVLTVNVILVLLLSMESAEVLQFVVMEFYKDQRFAIMELILDAQDFVKSNLATDAIESKYQGHQNSNQTV